LLEANIEQDVLVSASWHLRKLVC